MPFYVLTQGSYEEERVCGVTMLDVEARRWEASGDAGSFDDCRSFYGPFELGLPKPESEPVTTEAEFDAWKDALPPAEEITWDNCGLDPVSIQIMKNVAAQFPGSATDQAVRGIDKRTAEVRAQKSTTGTKEV